MKARDFFLTFLATFALAFGSCLPATLGWNYISHQILAVDWQVCFTLAVIVGFIVPLSELRLKGKSA
ncbi:MAG: hypothetical protein ACLFPE_15940 [Bacteroidales bacterium]